LWLNINVEDCTYMSVHVYVLVRSWVGPCGICGGQSGTGISFSQSTSVFASQFHSTGAPLLGKNEKTDQLSLCLHYKGCTISLKTAVCP
jgi:hypothetical protein